MSGQLHGVRALIRCDAYVMSGADRRSHNTIPYNNRESKNVHTERFVYYPSLRLAIIKVQKLCTCTQHSISGND